MFQIPLEPEIRIASDDGVPVVISAPDSAVSKAYIDVARRVVSKLADQASQQDQHPEISL